MLHESAALQLVGQRIVTVEDEAITQMQLRKMLTKAGLVVVGQAMNGQEGVELILRQKPDLVLMDITMPLLNGLEATRRVLEHYHTCIVILTAYATADYERQAQECGAMGFVVKPVSSETLIPLLNQIYVSNCLPEKRS